MEEATRGTGVTVSQTSNNELKLDIQSDISFDTGNSQIKPQMRPVLDQFAYGLKGNPAATVQHSNRRNGSRASSQGCLRARAPVANGNIGECELLLH